MGRFVTFSYVEFPGIDGEVVTVRGLPLLSRFEFRARIDRIRQILQAEVQGDTSLPQLYDSHQELRHNLNQCLALFKIDPANVSFEMVCHLLLSRVEGDEVRPGLLCDLEFPPTDRPAPRNQPEPTDGEIFAALWSHTPSLGDAIAAATNPELSGRMLSDAMAARAAQSDPKSAQRAEAEKWRKRAEELKQREHATTPRTAAPPNVLDIAARLSEFPSVGRNLDGQ